MNLVDILSFALALTVLVKNVPKQLSQWLLQILPTVWNTLTHSAHVYVACVVNETEEAEEQVDVDGTIYSIFSYSFPGSSNLKMYFQGRL